MSLQPPKKLSQRDYHLIETILSESEHKQLITESTKEAILSQYLRSPGISFVKMLIIIGSLLLGAGILSFIASNWSYIDRPGKLAIILGFLLLFTLTSQRLKAPYPKTAQGLLYVGLLTFGAGIFLIGQMFHFSSDFNGAFLLWGLGILPLALLHKDLPARLASLLLLHFWMFYPMASQEQCIPWAIALLPLYFIQKDYRNHPVLQFFAISYSSIWLLTVFIAYNVPAWFGTFAFLGLSLILLALHQRVFRVSGSIIFAISSLLLTVPETFRALLSSSDATYGSVACAIGLGGFLLYRIKNGSIFSIALICALIFRYYVDLTYAFLPKSLFFIVGGILLMGFGIWIERSRRERRSSHEQ